jgi:hypothetical protein
VAHGQCCAPAALTASPAHAPFRDEPPINHGVGRNSLYSISKLPLNLRASEPPVCAEEWVPIETGLGAFAPPKFVTVQIWSILGIELNENNGLLK